MRGSDGVVDVEYRTMNRSRVPHSVAEIAAGHPGGSGSQSRLPLAQRLGRKMIELEHSVPFIADETRITPFYLSR